MVTMWITIVQLTITYQCWFPGFDTVQLWKVSHLGQGHIGLWGVCVTSFGSIITFKKLKGKHNYKHCGLCLNFPPKSFLCSQAGFLGFSLSASSPPWHEQVLSHHTFPPDRFCLGDSWPGTTNRNHNKALLLQVVGVRCLSQGQESD